MNLEPSPASVPVSDGSESARIAGLVAGSPTALDFPDCRACQMWQDAGASWPRPCKQHYGGETA